MDSDPNVIHVDLLRRLFALQSYRPVISKRTKRASVALIIRVRPHHDPIAMQPSIILPKKIKQKKSSKPSAHSVSSKVSTPMDHPITSEVKQSEASPTPMFSADFDQDKWLAQSWVRNGDLELLYMRRAANPNDRWSGQVAFPGGRQAKGETDYDTAVRETKEEVGLDLSDRSSFQFICRLNDLQIDPFKNTKPLNVCSFVFLQTTPLTPPLVLEPSEVSSIVWCPFAFFGALLPPGWTQSPSTAIRNLPTKFFRALGGAPQGIQSGALPRGRWLGSPLPWQELNYLSYYKNQNKVASAPLIHSSQSDNASNTHDGSSRSNALHTNVSGTVTVLTTGFGVLKADTKSVIPNASAVDIAVSIGAPATNSDGTTSRSISITSATSTSTTSKEDNTSGSPASPETDEQLTEEENAEIAAVFKSRDEPQRNSQDPISTPSPNTESEKEATQGKSVQSREQEISDGKPQSRSDSHSSSPWLPIRLTFPALHLPGVGIDSEGTVFSSQGSPQFLLWGFTLRTTGQLFRLLDVPYVDEHVRNGNAQRRRNLNLYHRYVEARGAVAHRMQQARDIVTSVLQSTTSTLQRVVPEDHQKPRNGSSKARTSASAPLKSETLALVASPMPSSPTIPTTLGAGQGIVVHGQHSALTPLSAFRSEL